MNNVAKLIVMTALAAVGVIIAFKLVATVISGIFAIIIPVALLAGIAYAIYSLSGGKRAIGGRGSRYLP